MLAIFMRMGTAKLPVRNRVWRVIRAWRKQRAVSAPHGSLFLMPAIAGIFCFCRCFSPHTLPDRHG